MRLSLSELILRCEPVILGIIGFAFWYPAPPRDQWTWLLVLLLPVLVARWQRYGRLWTRTPLDGWLAAFLALAIANMVLAPYTRGWIMLARPLFGMALYYSFVEHARQRSDLSPLLQATTWLALLVGFLSLTATQWNSKSAAFAPVLNALPILQRFPGAEGGFNANEIAGAITWLLPLMAGVALYQWRVRQPYAQALLAFLLLTLGVFLGQSRLALLGVGIGLGLLAFLAFPDRSWRALALALLALAVVLEFMVISYTPDTAVQSGLSARDEQSLVGRQDIWQSALAIVRDYPLTGVGMSMFRDGRVRERYPAPGFPGDILPHTHNEWLQVATDLGLPGLVVYADWHLTIGFMLLKVWRQGDKMLAAGACAGLFAHAVFGLADSITLWDRFSFIYWWLLGLVGAQFTFLKYVK
jgi:putative inorganic carbon (HCO3(-)) transporter